MPKIFHCHSLLLKGHVGNQIMTRLLKNHAYVIFEIATNKTVYMYVNII